jgi:hypothetical protein
MAGLVECCVDCFGVNAQRQNWEVFDQMMMPGEIGGPVALLGVEIWAWRKESGTKNLKSQSKKY